MKARVTARPHKKRTPISFLQHLGLAVPFCPAHKSPTCVPYLEHSFMSSSSFTQAPPAPHRSRSRASPSHTCLIAGCPHLFPLCSSPLLSSPAGLKPFLSLLSTPRPRPRPPPLPMKMEILRAGACLCSPLHVYNTASWPVLGE